MATKNFTRFLHIADLHLGKRQYNSNERYRDYFRAFEWVLDYAIREDIDFILIAGDIFDSRKVGPSVLIEVYHIIRKFKRESQSKLNREIPVICIEGNHDNPVYHSRRSWMKFLADLELIILLSCDLDKKINKLTFNPYDFENHYGGMMQIENVRIYGLPFYGSSTPHLFPLIYDAMSKEDSHFNILMMHFGIEGEDPSNKPGIGWSEGFNKLHERVDYLALGHYHKQYKYPSKPEKPWIFNPGSLEITDIKEAYKDYPRGAFDVKFSKDGKNFQSTPISFQWGDIERNEIPNRFFQVIPRFTIQNHNTFEETINFILDYVKKFLKPRSETTSINDLNCPIVYFNLEGEFNYPRIEININRIRSEIIEKFAVLDVRIFSPHLVSTLDTIVISKEKKTMEELETEVFTKMVNTNPLFENISGNVVELMKNIKTEIMARSPNYTALKDFIIDWCLQNASTFNIPTDFVEHERENEILDEILDEKKVMIKVEENEDEYLDDYIDDDED